MVYITGHYIYERELWMNFESFCMFSKSMKKKEHGMEYFLEGLKSRNLTILIEPVSVEYLYFK